MMVAGTLIVPFGDAMSKLLATVLLPVEVAFWRFVFQTAFLGLAMVLLRRRFTPGHAGLVVVGGLTAAGTLISLIGAFSVMPIATAITLFFVEPLVLTMFSVWFLGERANWKRVLGVVVGFAGAVVVIRPSWAMFGWQAVLPLVGAASFAGNAVVMRKLKGQMSGLATQFWFGLIAVLVIGAGLGMGVTLGQFSFGIGAGPTPLFWLLPLMGALSGGTFLLFTGAFRRAEAGTLAPLQYLEIIGATAVGYWFFGDFPDLLTWVGAAIILGSGLFVLQSARSNNAVNQQTPPNA